MHTEDMTFIRSNGYKIAAKAFIPDDVAKSSFPVVIFAHGFGGNYRELMHHGDGFAEAGIICLFFDFCGGGMKSLSDGQMSEMTVYTEIEDLKCVIEGLKNIDCVDKNRIFLQGESMGGFVSAYVASDLPKQIKAMVLWYPAFVIPDDAKKRCEADDHTVFGMQISREYDLAAKDIDIFDKIQGYRGPVLIIHGDRDDIVPISYSHRAVELYKNAELVTMKGAGHGYDGEDSIRAREISVDFISKYI
ncbi:MAG: alpha/beta fold hydrolase [Lachnospiraceae bacterium]|nr:alpha/beta fold hydrolase [Lachnospiraceae bacterium]